MIENGYLAEKRSVHDLRSIQVRLTEKGLKLRDRPARDARAACRNAEPDRNHRSRSQRRNRDAAPSGAILDPHRRSRRAARTTDRLTSCSLKPIRDAIRPPKPTHRLARNARNARRCGATPRKRRVHA
jgi:hypothetical protein